MTPAPAASVAAQIDEYLFVKNGYAFWKHLIPLGIASTLLLLLSLPDDNLLVRLLGRLQANPWLVVAAGALLIITFLVYLGMMENQVQQAYLFQRGSQRRALLTALLFIFLGTGLVSAVLSTSAKRTDSAADVLASLLLTLLSLTGLGWSGPSAWVEGLGVKVPDYTAGQHAINRLFATLDRVRQNPRGTWADVQEVTRLAQQLRGNLDTNLELEPDWAKPEIEAIRAAVDNFLIQLEDSFKQADPSTVEQFAAACACQNQKYADYIQAMRRLGEMLNCQTC